MTLYLATENAGKVAEMKAILQSAAPPCPVLSIADLDAATRARYRADETGDTYAANALIKARALAVVLADAKTPSVAAAAPIHPWILAEDSGFEVAALGNQPGVHSARYGKDDHERCTKILTALAGQPGADRTAKFVACMVLLGPGENPTFFFGRKEGCIAVSARGHQGFGYDPIFCPGAGDKTWGELGAAEKNRDSHRSRALRLVARYIAAQE